MTRAGWTLLVALLAGACATGDDDDSATPEPTPAPGPGRLDTSGVGDARVGEPYAATLAVADYDGPVTFTPTGLPPGLSLAEDGEFSGIPERFGIYQATVVASGMEGVRDFTGRLVVQVRPALADGPFLGFARTYLNNAWFDTGVLRDPWVRVGDGVFVLQPGIYTAGPDGEATAGLRDDELVEALDPGDVTVEVGEFVPTPDVEPSPPDNPSGHFAEGDPPAWDPLTGTVTAGADAGAATYVLRHPDHDDVAFRVAVLPPDWCPSDRGTACE